MVGDLERGDLVSRAMAGDLEAFTELARLWVDRLYGIARLILRDPDRFESWLRSLLVHACFREARRNRRRRVIEAQVEPATARWADPESGLAVRDELERGLSRLTPEQRALVVP